MNFSFPPPFFLFFFNILTNIGKTVHFCDLTVSTTSPQWIQVFHPEPDTIEEIVTVKRTRKPRPDEAEIISNRRKKASQKMNSFLNFFDRNDKYFTNNDLLDLNALVGATLIQRGIYPEEEELEDMYDHAQEYLPSMFDAKFHAHKKQLSEEQIEAIQYHS